MRATPIEFRLRMLINAAIITLGFWAPWIGVLAPPHGFASRISTLEWLASTISRLGLLSFTHAAPFVLAAAAAIAALGAVLRISGAAYLSPAVVQHPDMLAVSVTAAGPYRYVRNPLYIGLWCMVAAITLTMPPSGALCTMVLLSCFLLRLILGEEAFLAGQLGEPYKIYCQAVPRLIPRLPSVLPRLAAKPQWLRGFLSELLPVGVFITFAVVSWSYNNRLMLRAILVSLGVSLVARAFVGPVRSSPAGSQ